MAGDRKPLERLFDDARGASRARPRLTALPSLAGRGLILVYRYSLSALIGRQCRHLPSCSEYTDEAIARYGLWRGGWIGVARICRCGPFGTHGIDNVPDALPQRARWYMPWRYGRWRGVNGPARPKPACDPIPEAQPKDGG